MNANMKYIEKIAIAMANSSSASPSLDHISDRTMNARKRKVRSRNKKNGRLNKFNHHHSLIPF